MIHVLSTKQSPTPTLFRTLFSNGCFLLTSGIIYIVLSEPLAAWIGLTQPLYLVDVRVVILVVIGFALMPSGLRLIWTARSEVVSWTEALTVSAMDLSWVLITLAVWLVVPDLLPSNGLITATAVACVVFLLFEFQVYALWSARPIREF